MMVLNSSDFLHLIIHNFLRSFLGNEKNDLTWSFFIVWF